MKFFPVAFGALFDVPNCDPDGADRLGSDHVPRLVLHLSVVGVVIFNCAQILTFLVFAFRFTHVDC